MSPDSLPPDLDSEHPPMSRSKKIVWTVIVLAIVVGIGFIVHARIVSQRGGGSAFTNQALRQGFNAPLAVGVAKVTRGDVPITIDSLGTVTPLATVSVHPQVTGPLVKISFTEGQSVKKGDLLAEIDPRPFQATVEQDQAQLQHDQALLNNANVDLERYKMLVATNSVAEQTYATQQATVLQDQATVAADKAALDSAKLNLSYCYITAPVDGSIGLRQVDVGNVVSAYSSTIAVVTQLHPMSVLFTIPEDDLSLVLGRLRQGDKLQAVAYDRTFTTRLDTGLLSHSDNQVDPTTGTLKLRALFNNSAMQLFPQQFVNVRLTLNTLHDQILVPASAVQTGDSGSYVYIVGEGSGPGAGAPGSGSAPFDDLPAGGPGAGAASGQGRRGGRGAFGGRRFRGAGNFPAAAGPVHTVHLVYVTTGPGTGDMVSIRSGLSVGQTVVVDGAEQLKDGAPVTTPELDQPAGAGSKPGTGPTAQPGSPQGAGASGGPAAGTPGSPYGGAYRGGRGAGFGYGYGANGKVGAGRGPRGAAGAQAPGAAGSGSAAGSSAPGAQPASQP